MAGKGGIKVVLGGKDLFCREEMPEPTPSTPPNSPLLAPRKDMPPTPPRSTVKTKLVKKRFTPYHPDTPRPPILPKGFDSLTINPRELLPSPALASSPLTPLFPDAFDFLPPLTHSDIVQAESLPPLSIPEPTTTEPAAAAVRVDVPLTPEPAMWETPYFKQLVNLQVLATSVDDRTREAIAARDLLYKTFKQSTDAALDDSSLRRAWRAVQETQTDLISMYFKLKDELRGYAVRQTNAGVGANIRDGIYI